MEGWIKIHRQIKEHWIWDDPLYLKAWIGILLTVNHEDKKVLIQGEIIECKRGQSLLSLMGWVKCFGKKWTMQRVRTFFELLKKDQMIITEGLRKTTRLTVCKYDEYQYEQQAKNKQRTSKEQAKNNEITINNNDKEGIKNEKNEEETEIDKAWLKWKDYKKAEFNFKYKSEISEQAAKTELINLSGNDEEIAIKIINQSIAKGWKGLFKLENNGTNKKTGGATNEQLAELIASKFGVDSPLNK